MVKLLKIKDKILKAGREKRNTLRTKIRTTAEISSKQWSVIFKGIKKSIYTSILE